MKAITYERYGPPQVLQLREMEKPAPAADEVLIKVRASSVNAMEWHMMRADMFVVRLMTGGLRKPKHNRLGTDVAGVVEAVGANARQFQPGDAVFGFGRDTYAEYAVASQGSLLPKPANLTFEQAAAVPVAALTAFQGLRSRGKIQAGQQVLIQGASGGVGSFAVQIAKAFGTEVTAVCSPRNIDQARALGADHVIDYTKEDFTRAAARYDLILGANGYHPLWAYRRALKPNGVYVMAGGTMAQIFQAMLLGRLFSKAGGQTMTGVSAGFNGEDLAFLKTLLEAGKITPVVDRCYPLENIVEAFRYFEEVHPKGKVIITIQ